MTTTAINNK